MKPWQEEIMIGLTALGLLTVALAVVQLGNMLGGIGEQIAAVASTAVAVAAIGALSLMLLRLFERVQEGASDV
jgi:hypothetical protein